MMTGVLYDGVPAYVGDVLGSDGHGPGGPARPDGQVRPVSLHPHLHCHRVQTAALLQKCDKRKN